MAQHELVETLLLSWRAGDAKARDRLVALLLPDLRRIASARLRGEANSSLATGDLVNDTMLRFFAAGASTPTDRSHFLKLVARIMRNVLVDHARAKNSDKRHHHKVELYTQIDGGQRLDLETLNFALIQLGTVDVELMELIEMRYFGGMTVDEVALATGCSPATVKRRWRSALAWLTDAMTDQVDHG